MLPITPKTKAEAREHAIEWQHRTANKSMSYSEIIEWSIHFEAIARKWHLVREFKENGII